MTKPYMMPTAAGGFAAVVPSPYSRHKGDPNVWPAVRLLCGTKDNARQIALTPLEAIRLADALHDAVETMDPERNPDVYDS